VLSAIFWPPIRSTLSLQQAQRKWYYLDLARSVCLSAIATWHTACLLTAFKQTVLHPLTVRFEDVVNFVTLIFWNIVGNDNAYYFSSNEQLRLLQNQRWIFISFTIRYFASKRALISNASWYTLPPPNGCLNLDCFFCSCRKKVRSPSALNDTALLNGSVVKSDDVSDRLLIALSTVASTIRDETLPSSQVTLDDRSVVHEDILNKDQNPQYYLPPGTSWRNRA